MGQNDYKGYNKEDVDVYTARMNALRQTAAEGNLRKRTQARPEKMRPMEGVENQPIGVMEAETGEGHLLTMETRNLGRQHARPMKALDIGTFTGHSAGAIAKGMENGGTVVTIDVTDQYKSDAELYWQEEGVADRIDFRIRPVAAQGGGGAGAVLDELLSDPDQLGTFDIAFIDADKLGYDGYYERALKLLRPGGKILLDNMMWSGRVANKNNKEPTTVALRNLTEKVMQDPRVDPVLLNCDDGILVVEKLGFTRQAAKSLGEKAR